MWLIKLPFRIIALPIMAIVAVFSIFYFLALNLSAMVAGLLYLVLGVCIVMLLFQHAWIYAALVLDLQFWCSWQSCFPSIFRIECRTFAVL